MLLYQSTLTFVLERLVVTMWGELDPGPIRVESIAITIMLSRHTPVTNSGPIKHGWIKNSQLSFMTEFL